MRTLGFLLSVVVMARTEISFIPEGKVAVPAVYGHLIFELRRGEVEKMFHDQANTLLASFRK